MWDPVDKKVFRSRDIIFMEDKTLADWESEKKIMNPDEIRTHPTEIQLTLEEPACYGEDDELSQNVNIKIRTCDLLAILLNLNHFTNSL